MSVPPFAMPIVRPACWRCGRWLRVHERSERICDACLRASQWAPSWRWEQRQ